MSDMLENHMVLPDWEPVDWDKYYEAIADRDDQNYEDGEDF